MREEGRGTSKGHNFSMHPADMHNLCSNADRTDVLSRKAIAAGMDLSSGTVSVLIMLIC